MTDKCDSQLFPLLRVAIVIASGIAAGDTLVGIVPPLVWQSLTFAALLLAFALFRKPLAQSVAILLCVFSLGCWLVTSHENESKVGMTGTEEEYDAVVIGTPVAKGKTVRCELLVASGRLCGRKVRAYFLSDGSGRCQRELYVGAGLKAASMFREPDNYHPSSHFDYVRWMQVQGFAGITFILPDCWKPAEISISRLSRLARVKLRALQARESLLQRYRMANADTTSYAVIAAMTLGDKSALTSGQKEIYSITGASHVLALSGLHLGVIYAILSLLFSRRRWRLFGQVAIVVAMWAYVFMVGMAPSVLRSATMFTIYAMVSLLNRERMSMNVLSLTAIVMLCLNPLCLWDVGAQMSFLAVAGILLFYNTIYHSLAAGLLMRHRLLNAFWSMAAVSIASQLGVAPLVMYYFGRFSCLFLLTNMVAVPLSTLIIYCAFFMFVSVALPAVCAALSRTLFLLADVLNGFLGVVAKLPWASVDGISIQAWHVAAMYAVILSLHASLRIVRRASHGKRYTLKYSSS